MLSHADARRTPLPDGSVQAGARRNMNEPTLEQMIQELKEAGWIECPTCPLPTHRPAVWRSPGGQVFLGPYGAWKRMNLDREALKQCQR